MTGRMSTDEFIMESEGERKKEEKVTIVVKY